MHQLIINFDNEKRLKVFMDWLDGQGEDNWWIWEECNYPNKSKLTYDYKNKQIYIKEIK